MLCSGILAPVTTGWNGFDEQHAAHYTFKFYTVHLAYSVFTYEYRCFFFLSTKDLYMHPCSIFKETSYLWMNHLWKTGIWGNLMIHPSLASQIQLKMPFQGSLRRKSWPPHTKVPLAVRLALSFLTLWLGNDTALVIKRLINFTWNSVCSKGM